MVGIPKSSRCQRCKARKVKCDEAWPTCGPCKRAHHICSGPPILTKFVHNGRHDSPQNNDEDASVDLNVVASKSLAGACTMVSIRCRTMQGGGRFQDMRICSTLDEQLANRLVAMHVANLNTGFDANHCSWFLDYLPQRIGESVALRDSVNCFLTCWENCRKGVSYPEILSRPQYGKSLRSLQQALNDPKQRYTTGTLAATALLCKTEARWDNMRATNRNEHGRGLYSLLELRGPPSIDDELAVILSLELVPTLISQAIVANKCSFHNEPKWRQLWDDALEAGLLKAHGMAKCYPLHQAMAAWPSLKQSLLNLLKDPPQDDNYMRQAEALFLEATAWSTYLENFDNCQLGDYRDNSDIREIPSPNPLLPEIYAFANPEAARLFIDHAMLSIVVGTIAAEASALLGCPDLDFEVKRYGLSRRIWKSFEYYRGLKPLAGSCIVTPLLTSFEAADEAMREFLIDCLSEFDHNKRWLKRGRWIHDCILSNCRAMSGRLPYLPTQDVNVELRKEGARS